jgi:peptidyl-prolyl cis-trans isomerase C
MHVLLQETKSRNITVTDADLSARIDELKKQFPSEEEFTKALAARNMTVDALREEARSEIAVSKMMQAEVSPQIKIQDGDIKAFYDKNPQQFQEPESFRASHILIRVDLSATEAQKKEARARIAGLLQQVQQGADFAAIAKANSQDGSAPNGGDLNYFRKGQMVAPFQQAVEALKVGEVSGVVETQFGYHIIKLTDRKAARIVPLAEVSPRIGQFLMMREQQQKAGSFVESLKAKSKIEILI